MQSVLLYFNSIKTVMKENRVFGFISQVKYGD